MPPRPFGASCSLSAGAAPPNCISLTVRPSLLLATRTVPQLADDVLMLLFAKYQVELLQEGATLSLQGTMPLAVALLSASAGADLLALTAHTIRACWPLARIIVLGKAPRELEDYLYDHTVPEGCTSAMLIAAFNARSAELWNYHVVLDGLENEGKQIPSESDSSKAVPSDLEEPSQPRPWDLPADEQEPKFVAQEPFTACRAVEPSTTRKAA